MDFKVGENKNKTNELYFHLKIMLYVFKNKCSKQI